MTTTPPDRRVQDYLQALYPPDPFADVYAACEPHGEAHGPDCGVYPAEPAKMRTLATLIRAAGARRILEIGGGLGYSALWLADAAGPAGRVETIDRSAQHTELIERYAAEHGLSGRLAAVHGEAVDILPTLSGPYDAVHDDGWFGEQPAYYERMIELLRPGGMLLLANLFLLEDAISGKPRMDWAQFAGPDWAENVTAYARTLVADPRLDSSFIMRPAWIGLAVRKDYG